MKQILVLALAAAIALMGISCTSPTGPIYPMTVGSVWNMSTTTLYGAIGAALDTWSTSTITITAQQEATLANGKEVTKLENEETIHDRSQDTATVTQTSYSYVAEVGDSILSYVNTSDTIGTTVLRSTPAVGQTWSERSGATATVVGQEDVTVAAGTYKGAWKVKVATTIIDAPVDMYEWYARGTGLVKDSFDLSAMGTETNYRSELTSATIK
jgi:hypothetical protein